MLAMVSKMLILIFKRFLYKNCYLLLGIVLGIMVSQILEEPTYMCDPGIKSNLSVPKQKSVNVVNSSVVHPVSLQTPKPVARNVTTTKKDSEKFVRPRFYSTELGIREKLFIGVFTSEDKVNTQATYINQTVAHLVDKVKFFITVRNKMKSTFNLSGIVGFTDTRHKYRPFQVIKYIGDTFMQDYDYYFLINDYNYLNIRKLKDLVGKISTSQDVYLGTGIEDSSFCNLDAGVVLSNSVVRAMKENLEWCISNAVSDDRSENFGRCVHYSTNLECQEEVQGQKLVAYKMKHFKLEKYFEKLTKRRRDFRDAVIVHPILSARDFFLLNAYFCRLRLEELKLDINHLSANLNDSWPPGQKVSAKPATRFDLPTQLYFNTTHMFFPDDFTNVRKHKAADFLDIQNIIEEVKNNFFYENHVVDLQYRRLINGYRTFDFSRGMEYTLDLGFRDLNTGKEVVKRFEVCKPLGEVEFVPVPYVTENPRVTILLPVQETNIEHAGEFLMGYDKTIMQHREKSLLILILYYQYNSSSKGESDKFAKLKQEALKLSNKYRSEDTRVIWVSIRLPYVQNPIQIEERQVLNFATIDLALKKVGLESLVLVLDIYADISVDCLNRIRMNTISGFQIFSPIPFRQYDPKVTKLTSFEINKNSGHFDREEYKFISFYGRDYVAARKKMQEVVPIIRTDNDIAQILQNNNTGNVFEMFVVYSDNLHCMRATEKDLKVRYHEETNENRANLFFGTKVQLAKLMLDVQEKLGLPL